MAMATGAAAALASVGVAFGSAGVVSHQLGYDLWPDWNGRQQARLDVPAASPSRAGTNPLGPGAPVWERSPQSLPGLPGSPFPAQARTASGGLVRLTLSPSLPGDRTSLTGAFASPAGGGDAGGLVPVPGGGVSLNSPGSGPATSPRRVQRSRPGHATAVVATGASCPWSRR